MSGKELYASDFVENPAYEGKRDQRFKAPMVDHRFFVPSATFEEYKDKYKETWILDRTEDGIMTARWHTDGDELQYNYGFHRSMWQLFKDVGQDADTEVLIVGGTGNTFLKKSKALIDERANMKWYAYEHMFFDGPNNVNAQLNDLRIPTIGIINGDGLHIEMACLCDITIMADDAVISDPHFVMGGIPGDGIQITLDELLGHKRAAYAMYMNEQITAQRALELGLVNEIVPREKLWERAMEIAQHIMKQPRIIRRLTSEIVKQPWQRAYANMRSDFGMEMWSFMANETLCHDSGWANMNADEAQKKNEE